MLYLQIAGTAEFTVLPFSISLGNCTEKVHQKIILALLICKKENTTIDVKARNRKEFYI